MNYFLTYASTGLAILAIASSSFAQNLPVNQSPETKKAVIEEFTGLHCPNCPTGHLLTGLLKDAHGDELIVMNFHATSFANPNSGEPNFKTDDGNQLKNFFNISGVPSGPINRRDWNNNGSYNHNADLNANNWDDNIPLILAEIADVNVSLDAQIVNDTVLNIDVELFYTTNSPGETHKLTIGILQSEILGPQSNMNNNPNYVLNGQYRHMHAFRTHITTPEGDDIDASTSGVISMSYTYIIPDSVRNIPVDINHLEIFALVHQGLNSPGTSEILNAAITDAEIFIDDVNTAELSVIEHAIYTFPNPATDELNIVSNSEEVAMTRVVLHDQSGRELLSLKDEIQNNSISIDISHLSAGSYILTIETESGTITRNIVK